MSVQIDLVTSGTRGLRLDAEIVYDILSPLYKTEINVSRQRNAHLLHRRLFKGLSNRLKHLKRIVLFFEILPTGWMRIASSRILIPNQEWMRQKFLTNLPGCSQIWCKTRYAENIFRQRGFDARYIGFSSRDIYSCEIGKDYRSFVHVAGRSHLKGTKTILEVWQKHPEWPLLTVVTSDRWWTRYASSNIDVREGYLSDSALHALMNRSGVHLCPSESEGWGHYISEALSTKAVVITVAAPPMNEMVAAAHGLLASYNRVEPFNFGERFFVDPVGLECQVETALQMSDAEKASIGEAARSAFLRRREAFSEALRRSVGELAAAM